MQLAAPLIMFDDIRTVTATAVRERCGRLPAVVVGSPPCQDASAANASGRGIAGERTGLFFEAIRVVGECRPVWGCLENVAGLRGRGLDRVLGGLEAHGYAVWPLVMAAKDFGAPHVRKRIWIIFADSDKARLEGYIKKRESICDVSRAAFSDVGGYRIRHGVNWPSVSSFVCVGNGVSRGSLAKIVAAYGDAIVPQIAEAIGRSMMTLCPTDGTVLDLFCGAAGGWSLGVHKAGYRTIAACEIDPWRRAIFSRHMDDQP